MTAAQRSRQHRPTNALVALTLVVCATMGLASEPAPAGNAAAADAAKDAELLRAIASQARSPVKNENQIVRIDGHPVLGNPDAVLTLIEFSDLQCGFCRRHINSTFPVLLERYVSTGRMRYVFFDFPMEQKHPQAHRPAIAARCAAEQDAVQPMRERLYANPGDVHDDKLRGHAAALGLDLAAFSACIVDTHKGEAVRRDLALGQQLMVRGTPTFFVGYSRSDGTEVRVLRRIIGAQPLAVFEAAISGVVAEAQGSMAHLSVRAGPDVPLFGGAMD